MLEENGNADAQKYDSVLQLNDDDDDDSKNEEDSVAELQSSKQRPNNLSKLFSKEV